MRILTLLFTSMLLIGVATAQSDADTGKGYNRTYYMPDGAILKGRVIGRLAKDSVIVETRDGLVYHLSSAEARKSGKLFVVPGSNPQVVQVEEAEAVPPTPKLPAREQPNFQKGSSQIGVDLMTHFSSGDASANASPESGIVFSASYLYGVTPQLKVGGGFGIMTVKSGSKERLFPIFVRGEYQILPKISATLSAGYSIIPTNEFVLVAKNGFYSNANIGFDLVGPESAYTSRIGVGFIMQQLEIGRSEVIREAGFGFGGAAPRTYTQYVERSGLLQRVQITFTHAWRLPPAVATKSTSRSKAKRKKKVKKRR